MTMVAAVALLVRAELRRHRWALVLSALIVALVVGATLATAAGARRTASVLDRMQAEHPEPDLHLGVAEPLFASDADRVRQLERELAGLDGVERVVASHSILLDTAGPTDEMYVDTGPDERFLESIDVMMIDGRLPTMTGIDEVALDEYASDQLGLGVGDVLAGATMRPETAAAATSGDGDWIWDGPEVVLDVVGVYRSSLELDGTPGSIGSPDTGRYIGQSVAFEAGFAIDGNLDVVDIDEVSATAYAAVSDSPDPWIYWAEREVFLSDIRSTFDMLAIGLAVFALVALIAGLLALGQIVSRQIGQTEDVAPVARALGMSDRSITMVGAAPAAIAVVAGTIAGAVASAVLSPLFPVSAARRAEVDPGIRLDWVVLVAGSILMALTLSAWALVASRRSIRRQSERSLPTERRRWTSVRRMLPVSAQVGMGSMEHTSGGNGTRGASVSAVAGSVLGIAGVLAIAVFVVSQQVAAGDDQRFGWGWDSQPWGASDDVAAAMVDDERLAAVGTASCGQGAIADDLMSLCTISVLRGSMTLTVLEGRSPTSPDEVAMGRITMEEHDLDLGDVVALTDESGAVRDLTLVGTVVQPDENAPGRGLVVNEAGFAQMAGENIQQYLLLSYPEGVDAAALEAELADDYAFDIDAASHPIVPQALRQLDQLRATLLALAAFLGVLGAVGLVHFLVLSWSRRRRDTAVLKAVGFVRRQVVAMAVWQAVAVAVVGVVVGVPLGIIIGRWVWTASVDHIGIADDPAMPWVVAVVVALTAVVGAAAVALVPGSWAARRSPTEELRTE